MINETANLPYKVKAGFREWTAVGMLLAGCGLTWIDYFLPTPGEISDSVLRFFSECLIYAGTMLGISIYVNAKVRDLIKKISPNK